MVINLSPTGRPVLVWGTALGSLVIYDIVCDKGEPNGDTLSEATRLVYRTHTRAGKVAFVASWLTFSAWFIPHILKRAGIS